MFSPRNYLLVLLVLAASLTVAPPRRCGAGGVIITEFMASNGETLADEDTDYSDWLELYNATSTVVNLAGWYLTDTSGDLTRWPLPAVSMNPGDYLVVFASGKDRAIATNELHTDFKLDGDGEFLALVGSNGVDVSFQYAPAFPDQRRDVSYGVEDAANPTNFLYYTNATPGSANGSGIAGFVGDTTFSIDRGFYSNAFDVAITSSTAGATIRYTLDGSAPTESHGTVYVSPVHVDDTTVLRAMAYKNGYLSSDVDTQTYIFPDSVITQGNAPPGYPSTWSGRPADYEMDPEIATNAAYSGQMRAALLSIPTLSLVTDIDHLFHGSSGIYTHPTSSGAGWERPTSVELIHPDGSEGFQVNAGVRIQGGASRNPNNSPKHSFRLLFKDAYGPTKLRYPLFGGDATDSFDTIVLRARYNLSWIHWDSGQRNIAQYARDQFIRDAQLAMGHPSPHGTYVHLYLNGIYWGLFNPSERPSGPFCASYLGGEREEYDALNSGQAVDGNKDAWNAMMTVVNSGLGTPAAYATIRGLVDVDNLIDYMLLNIYGANRDWDHHNWYAGRRRTPDGRWRFFSWDAEHIFRGNTDNVVNENNNNNPSRIYANLRANPEFRVLFADHVHEHLFNDGVLTVPSVTNRWMERANEISQAVIAESARWGDHRRDVHQRNGPNALYARNTHWLVEQQRLLNTYFPQRTATVINQLTSAGLYTSLAAPDFNQHGGDVAYEFQLTISNLNASGTIFYTLDTTDPRLPYDETNSTALVYTGPITLTRSVQVSARVCDAGEWSALCRATFSMPEPPPLRVTEIMYNPPAPSASEVAAGFTDNDDFEYLKLRNISTQSLDLTGVRFDDGISFDFTGGGSLGPGAYTVIARNTGAFEERYGTNANVWGQYSSKLSNGGENLRLDSVAGRPILDFEYNDAWYPITDGGGFSLVIVDDTADRGTWGDEGSWRPSAFSHGSPGGPDPGLAPGSVVVNEALTHTDGVHGDWIELKNTTDSPVDIGGWFISDNDTLLQKYMIASNTILAAGGFAVFTQTNHFGTAAPDPGRLVGFGLSELGEEVWLSSGTNGVLGGYRHGQEFGAAEKEVTFGRYVKSTGKTDFTAMSADTMGAGNTPPLVGPMVIHEIMYNPAGNGMEYLELRNVSGGAVTLYDAAHPTNTWRLADGVTYEFPTNVTVAAGALILVAPTNPAVFRSSNSIPAEIAVYGPYAGKLANEGEDVELHKPGEPEAGGPVPYIRVDRVNYDDDSPWPEAADGDGPSLVRVTATAYGNDVANWQAGIGGGSPGNIAPQVDAGTNQTVLRAGADVNVSLDGTVFDDGRPLVPGATTSRWSQVSGPGTVTFADATSVDTTVTLPTTGLFVLRLAAGDGQAVVWDEMEILVTAPPGVSVILSETEGSTEVAESGPEDTYTMILESAPVSAVTVQVAVANGFVAVNPTSLVFTVSTWNDAQSVSVTAPEDAVAEGMVHTDTVTHAVFSSDAYNGISVSNVLVRITDNDTAGVEVSKAGLNISEEGPTGDGYTVVLTSEPLGVVTVEVSTAAAEVDLNTQRLVFTASSWSNARSVVVTAIDDGDDEGLHSATNRHTVSSMDPAYDGIAASNVVTLITDNDAPGTLQFSAGRYDTAEGAGSVTVTVTRLNGSAGAVSVDYGTADGSALAGSDYGTVTGRLSWADGVTNSRSFTIPIHDDGDSEGFQSFTASLSNPSGAALTAPSNSTIRITDNEPRFAQHRRRVRISLAGYDRPATLTNFVLLVKLGAAITNFNYADFAGDNACDLGFSDASGSVELPYEIEEWDTNGESLVWVQVPELVDSNTLIWAYWDNDACTEAPPYTTNGAVWPADCLGVWHLGRTAGGAEDLRDSTSNRYDLADNGTDNATGLIGYSQDFQSGSDYVIDSDGEAYLNGLTAFTISVWLKSDVVNVDRSIFAGRGSDDDHLGVRYDKAGASGGGSQVYKMGFRTTTKGKTQWETASNVQTTEWQYMAFTWESGGTPVFYLDGATVSYTHNGGNIGGAITGCNKLQFGEGNKANWDGRMDEARVSGTARSADWIWACWMNQGANHAVFCRYGAVEDLTPPEPPTLFMFR